MAQKLIIAGNQKSVPAYYSGQPTHLAPNHYVSVEEARRLKCSGKASSINRGKAILIKGPRKATVGVRESVKKAWKVVGQTPQNAIKPGYPHYSLV